MQRLFLGSVSTTDIVPFGQGDSLPALPERRLTKPLRGVIACWDEELGRQMCRSVAACNPFLPVTVLNQQVEATTLERTIENERVAVLFLEVDGTDRSSAILDEALRLNRGTYIIAFSRHPTAEVFLQLMRRGLREWVKLPADEFELHAALTRARQALEFHPPMFRREGHLFSFLPAKPGCGASTVAAHAASLFASAVDGRSVLFDLDLNCGIQGFIHASNNPLTVADAAEYADRLDDSLWRRMLCRAGAVDVLAAGYSNPGRRLDPAALHSLLTFAETRYPFVCADLSGNWERYATETVERSSLIFLVTTPDFASLHLARRQLDRLEEIGARDRTLVILNRCASHRGLDRELLRELLGEHLILELPNVFEPLQSALKNGRLLPATSPFVQALGSLPARTLPGMAPRVARQESPRPGFQAVWQNFRSWLLPAA